jgi:hypothetical protein
MIVRYVRARGYKGKGSDPVITIGKLYAVLSVVFRPAPHSMLVCICTDADAADHSDGKPYSDGTPGLFDMSRFDIVDPRIPSEWSMLEHGGGYFRLCPSDFGGDFWDRFHDADSDAERTFETVVKMLNAYHARTSFHED